MFLQGKVRQFSVLHLEADTLDVLSNGCSSTAAHFIASSTPRLFPSPWEVIAQSVPWPASFCQIARKISKDPDTWGSPWYPGGLIQQCLQESLLQFSSSIPAIFGTKNQNRSREKELPSSSEAYTCYHSPHHVHQEAMAPQPTFYSGPSISQLPQNPVPTYVHTYSCRTIHIGKS